MSLLSKSNAKKHCRTCLIKINVEQSGLLEATVGEPITEANDVCKRISGNSELQSFINKYLIDERLEEFSDRLPQHVCISCFKTVQQANKFLAQAKLSAKTLYILISDDNDNEELQNKIDSNNFILKDSLMEMETIPLNNTNQNYEVADSIDPFSEKIVSKNPQENSKDDSEWDAHSIRSISSEINLKKKLRIPNTNGENNSDETCSSFINEIKDFEKLYKTQKKKRRSKQEMEEFRRQQREKIGSNPRKYKRRPKGTKNKYSCNQCDHRFAHQFTLDVHIRKIHEGDLRPYQCEHCPKTYAAMTGLTSHNQVEHSKDKLFYNCDFPDCNRQYTCLMGLQNHKRIKHTDPSKLQKFICEKCGTTFWKRSLLIYHRRAKHPTEAEKAKKTEVYDCDVCQSTLATKHSLKYHKIKYHSGEMKYECDVCGQKLAQKSSVEYHKLLHSTEKVPCKDCDKQFVREYDLMKHVRVVHMKLKPYKCSYCPESFASNKTMKHHQFIHTGEKPYACNLCEKSYRQPTCLKNHLKTHEKATTVSKLPKKSLKDT